MFKYIGFILFKVKKGFKEGDKKWIKLNILIPTILHIITKYFINNNLKMCK